ncbi:PIN domain-containing protein [Candidatus Woesearchaeota archaeon]|nr:PIN domain-containing protein [Candidatus Woesearchaeota archaeon]
MEIIKYFFDSYAIVEIVAGNQSYSKFINEPVTITIFNLAEIYWSAILNLEEKKAEEIYETYSACIKTISDEVLKEAIKFRKKHKNKDLSYTDCIGYIYALKNNMKFLTGDREFEAMENVEFIKK